MSKTQNYVYLYLTAETHRTISSYLRSGEHKRQQPSQKDESRARLGRIEALHGVSHRDKSVDSNQHKYESTEVQAEHL